LVPIQTWNPIQLQIEIEIEILRLSAWASILMRALSVAYGALLELPWKWELNRCANRFETAQHAFSPTSCNLGRVALRAVGGERLGDLE